MADNNTRDSVPDELICEDCHRLVDEDVKRCPRCKEQRRAGF